MSGIQRLTQKANKLPRNRAGTFLKTRTESVPRLTLLKFPTFEIQLNMSNGVSEFPRQNSDSDGLHNAVGSEAQPYLETTPSFEKGPTAVQVETRTDKWPTYSTRGQARIERKSPKRSKVNVSGNSGIPCTSVWLVLNINTHAWCAIPNRATENQLGDEKRFRMTEMRDSNQ